MYFTGIADEAAADLAGQIKAHKELGWEHIEIRCVDNVNFAEVSGDVFEQSYAMLQNAEMQVSCFGSAIANWARNIAKPIDQDIEDLKRSIPRMNKLGTKFIRIMSYPNDGWKVADWRNEVTKRLKVLTKMAEDGGIVLVMENCSGYFGEYPIQQTELFELIDSPGLKVVYDTGNPVGHIANPMEMYEAAKGHIAYVHVKDYKRTGDAESQAVYPGEGNGRVRDVLKDLFENGYDGGISIEPHMAGAIHLGQDASKTTNAYDLYLEYGRRMMKLVADVKS